MARRTDIAILGGLALLGVAGWAALLWGLYALLRPRLPAPDLAVVPSHPVVTWTATPDEPPPAEEPAEPVFGPGDLCPLEVVLAPEDGAAIADADVEAEGSWGPDEERFEVEGQRSADLTWSVAGCPCTVVTVDVRVRGYARVKRRDVDAVVERSITVPLVRGVRVTGTVTDLAGSPIEKARVHAGDGMDTTGSSGTSALRVDPAKVRQVRASAGGYLDDEVRLRLPADATEDVVVDLALERSREVAVWCAGLPGDSCAPVPIIMCTRLLLPLGMPCRGDPSVCRCPRGRVAIRGGGTSVVVPPDATEVWLDFRAGARVMGRALRGDDPSACEAMGLRLPEGPVPDLKNGLAAIVTSACDEEGIFRLEGLLPGLWRVEVRDRGDVRSVSSIRLAAGEARDVGDLVLGAGGVIEGVVLDGLTGQGTPGQAVSVVRVVPGAEIPDFRSAISASEGRFRVTGLDDGDYAAFLGLRPFTRVTVNVEEGKADREVVLETGQASLLEDNGFTLETDAEGDLVAGRVDEDGAAWAHGLESGDRINGIEVGGVDVGSLLPGFEDDLVEALLEHYGGPGVSLLVGRGNQTVRVPLE